MKGCADLAEHLKFQCCGSCHDDADELDYDMCYCEFNGEEYEVCCAGWEAIQQDNEASKGAGSNEA